MKLAPIHCFSKITFKLLADKCIAHDIPVNPFVCPKCGSDIKLYKTYNNIDWGVCPKCQFSGFSFDFYAEYRNLHPEDAFAVYQLLFTPNVRISTSVVRRGKRIIQLYTKHKEIVSCFDSNFNHPYCIQALAKYNIPIPSNADKIREFVGTTNVGQLYLLQKKGAMCEYFHYNGTKLSSKSPTIAHAEAERETVTVPLYDLPNSLCGFYQLDLDHSDLSTTYVFNNLNASFEDLNAGFVLPIGFIQKEIKEIILFNNPIYAIRCNINSWQMTNYKAGCLPFASYFNKEHIVTRDFSIFNDIQKKIFVIEKNDNNSIRTAIEQDGYIAECDNIDNLTKMMPTATYEHISLRAVYWKDYVAECCGHITDDFKRALFLCECGLGHTDTVFTGNSLSRTRSKYAQIGDYKQYGIDKYNRIYKVCSKHNLTILPFVFQIHNCTNFFNGLVTTCILSVCSYKHEETSMETTYAAIKTNLPKMIQHLINNRASVVRIVPVDMPTEALLHVHDSLFEMPIEEYNGKLGYDKSTNSYRFRDFSISKGTLFKEKELILPEFSLLNGIKLNDLLWNEEVKQHIVRHKSLYSIMSILRHLLAMCIMLKAKSPHPSIVNISITKARLLSVICKTLGMSYACPSYMKATMREDVDAAFKLRIAGHVNFPMFIQPTDYYSAVIGQRLDLNHFGIITSQNENTQIIHSVLNTIIMDRNSVRVIDSIPSDEALAAIKSLFFNALAVTTNEETVADYNEAITTATAVLKKFLNARRAYDLPYDIWDNPAINGIRFIQRINRTIVKCCIERDDSYLYPLASINRVIAARSGINQELRIPDVLLESGIFNTAVAYVAGKENVKCLAVKKKLLLCDV